MRDFMAFCLQILGKLVSMLFDFSLGGYSYGNFLVVCLLVSVLIGALVVRFGPSRSDYAARPPHVSDRGSGGPDAGSGG